MPRNGSGTYSLPAGNPVVTGTIVSSSWANTTLQDIATALTQSQAADGQTPVTGNVDMNNNHHTDVSDATAFDQYAVVHQIQEQAYTWCGTAGGTFNALTLTPDVPITAYVAGQAFQFIVAGANTAAVTVAVSGLSAKAVTKNGAIALIADNLVIDSVVEIIYDGTQFQVQGGISSGSETFTDLDVTNNLTTVNLTVSGDAVFEGAVDFPAGTITANDLSNEVLNLINGGGTGSISSGNGRLSIASGVSIMTQDYTAVTTVYYVGSLLFFNDGADNFGPFSIGELSQALASATYSPAASAADKNYDIFGWKDTLSVTGITRSGTTATVTTSAAHAITTGAIVYIAGAVQTAYNGYQTLTAGSGTTFTFDVAGSPTTPATGTITAATARISRGPLWRNAGQAITGASNATPIVITANSHGLSNGDSVEVTNVSGNTAANGVWTVANQSANTFELATSVGNAAYTGGGSFASRGTGASTTEIELIGSTYVNKIAITNGPVARAGTYLGTIHTNGSNQLDWKLGGAAAGGSPGYFSVWNVSNRVNVSSTVLEGTASWTYGASVARPMNNSTNNRISFVRGLNSEPVEINIQSLVIPYAGQGSGNLVGLDSITDQAANSMGAPVTAVAVSIQTISLGRYLGLPGLGFHFAQALEFQGTPAIGSGTWFGLTTTYTTAPLYSTAFFATLTA